MSTRSFVALACLALAATPVRAQQDARDGVATSVSWLAAHLHDADLVVLHVGPDSGYAAGHLPGARHVGLRQITAPNDDAGLAVEFGPDSMLQRQLADLGIGDRSRVVVVAAPDWQTSAMRVLSTLYYAGLGDRARVLDGGLAAWTAAGKPLTTEVPPATKGRLTIRPRHDFVVDAGFVGSHAGKAGWAVVDARGQAFYDGVRNSTFARNDPGKPGHVPGALSIGVSEVYADDGSFLPNDQLRALFTKAGVKPGDVVVGYCHIGIYANSIITAARILGHDVRLYDGSFQDWAKRNLPLETKPAGGQ